MKLILNKKVQIQNFVQVVGFLMEQLISRIGLTFDLDLLPTDLNINRDHLLIKDYLPTEIEASGAKC